MIKTFINKNFLPAKRDPSDNQQLFDQRGKEKIEIF